MRDQPPSPLVAFARRGAVALAVAVGLMAIYSCSLIVDTRSQQCQADGDCAMFGNASCDKATGLCVTASSTSTGSTGSTSSSTSSSSSSSGAPTCDVDGGIDGGGCYNGSLAMCPVTSNAELLNACADGCIPFNNSTRVPGLLAGGQLPPLPTQGPDGGF